jgi:TolB protein
MSIRRAVAIAGAGLTAAAVVTAAGTALAANTPTAATSAKTTTMISQNKAGMAGNGHSMLPGTSRTGRYVTFRSTSTNLIPRKPTEPFARDLFLWDRDAGKLEVLSVDSAGNRLPGHSGMAASPVTSDGKYVLFSSLVTKPTTTDPNHLVFDVFLRTRTGGGKGTTADLTPAGDGLSQADAISENGRYLTFTSEATNLVKGDTNAASDVYLRDLVKGKTTRVSVSGAGAQGDGASGESAVDASGRYVAFASRATNLVRGDTNGHTDVFLYDRVKHTTERISVTSAGQQLPDESERPAISGDGRYVAFSSFGPQNTVQVYLRDRVAGTTMLVSHANNGPMGNSVSTDPSVSGNGRYVAFRSIATNLIPGASDGIYLYDTTTRKLSLASVNNAGVPGAGPTFAPSVGDTGVAFQSLAHNLGGPPSSTYQVYYRSL